MPIKPGRSQSPALGPKVPTGRVLSHHVRYGRSGRQARDAPPVLSGVSAGRARWGAVYYFPARPCERARIAALVRLATPSLRKTLRTWFLTERSVMKSRLAIWRFERPSPIRDSTSHSRGVSAYSAAGQCPPAWASLATISPAIFVLSSVAPLATSLTV